MKIKDLIEKLQLVGCPDAVINLSDGELGFYKLDRIILTFPLDGDPYVVLY